MVGSIVAQGVEMVKLTLVHSRMPGTSQALEAKASFGRGTLVAASDLRRGQALPLPLAVPSSHFESTSQAFVVKAGLVRAALVAVPDLRRGQALPPPLVVRSSHCQSPSHLGSCLVVK